MPLRASLVLGLAALLLTAGARNARSEEGNKNELRAIGLAYHNYYDKHKRGPAKGDDLAPHIVGFEETGKRALDLLKSGDILFVYNVGLNQMPAGSSKTVLAYENGSDRSGGLVLLGDGNVKKMTVAEFKGATIAKVPAKEEKLLGKWKMVSSERQGRQQTVRVTQVIIKADKITFVGPDRKMSFDVEYEVDPSRKPKTIDIKNEKGDKTSPGIYALDGNTLKICTDKPGADRPKEFITKPGTDLNVIILEREKP